MPLSRHIETFKAFASSHLNGELENDYHINLKINHSLRVLNNAHIILDGEALSGHTAELTLLAALYHDIGRFPQYATYSTFKDADSINHGRLGVLALRELILPEGIPQQDWKTIRAAVGLHNVKELRPTTPAQLATVVKVVRDADKLDIYPIILDHLGKNANSKDIVIHGLEESQTKYSEAVYDAVFSEKTCDYSLMHYSNDFILLIIGWLFTLNYKTSIAILSKSGIIERAFQSLPQDDKFQRLKDKSLNFMHYNNLTAP